MKISAIHLKDFKSYKGVHKIEGLADNLSKDKNIVLIGGLNGAGKTSFLEAISLCFYGEGATELYPTKGARHELYHSYISSLFNRKTALKLKGLLIEKEEIMSAEVFLKDFNFTKNVSRNISIRREWVVAIKEGGEREYKREKLRLFEDGEELIEIDSSQYQDRINDMLPYSISQFFFFDGEKIQDFAKDADNEFAESLKNILGIGLYNTLEVDLKEVKSRIVREYNKNKEISKQLERTDREKRKIEDLIASNIEKAQVLQEELDGLNQDEEKIRYETRRITNITANNREDYQRQKIELQKERELLEVAYIESSKLYLPFILSNQLCNQLEMQIDLEEKYEKWLTTQEAIKPQLEGIVNQIFNEEKSSPPLSNDQEFFYKYKIKKTLNAFLADAKPNEVENLQVIHNLSSDEKRKIRETLRLIDGDLINDLQGKSERLKNIEVDLDRIRRVEMKAGDNTEGITKLFEKLEQTHQSIGDKRNQIRQLRDENLELSRKLKEINKSITGWQGKVKLQKKQKSQIDYCDELRKTIKNFTLKFQAKRAKELEKAIFKMWRKLAQKKDSIHNIKVLTDNYFEIKLFDANEDELDKTKISAGEKEIYAICLLWALVKVSGRSIPIVIDTPYGRLDSKHRFTLAKNYFPNAGEQVFILSQDEEVVEDFYDILKPHIAKELTIVYNERKSQSTVLDGYMFNQEKVLN